MEDVEAEVEAANGDKGGKELVDESTLGSSSSSSCCVDSCIFRFFPVIFILLIAVEGEIEGAEEEADELNVEGMGAFAEDASN
jgi:hypothetical protein